MSDSSRKIAVVFVAYGCVPDQRLLDHVKWNRPMYQQSHVKIYAVTDENTMIANSSLLRFPKSKLPTLNGKRVFSLSMTKNFGIQAALDDSADVIICTDVDIAFSQVAWDTMCSVESGQAIVPVYHLCRNFKNRHKEPSRIDYGMMGTVAMVAECWRKIQYDERCVAYGADDGLLLRDIRRAGLDVIPPYPRHPAAPVVWHVDHTSDSTGNVPGEGRSDCWGRAEGFNPDNFEENRKLHNERDGRGNVFR